MPTSVSPADVDHAFGLLTLVTSLVALAYSVYAVLAWGVRLALHVQSGCFKVDRTAPDSHHVNEGKKSKYIISIPLYAVIVAHFLSPFATDQRGLHDLVKGRDPMLDRVLELTPNLLRGPSPPLLLWNRHLQFAPWMIQNELHSGTIPYQRVDLEVTACLDKSEGPYCTPSPDMNDTVTLDIFPPLQGVDSEFNRNFNTSSPIILFAHGLRCYSQDLPGNMIVRLAFAEGFRSIAVNRRGHTPGLPLRAPRWNIFGDVDDLEQVYWHVKDNLADPNTPIFLHGISSGTAVTVSSLAEWDRRRALEPDAPSPSFVASISVTPGYDTSRVLRPERFKNPYNALMTAMVKDHFVRRNENLLRSYDSDAVDAALGADHLQEFVDAAAPFAGYPNASEYYRGENPVNDMHHISTPKLVLNSLDDPCCDVNNLYEESPYGQHGGKTYRGIVKESERGLIAVTRTGSHCPFLDGRFFPFVRDPLYGGWMISSWADRVSIEFYRAALVVYGDRRFL